jgi:hypothetical protein
MRAGTSGAISMATVISPPGPPRGNDDVAASPSQAKKRDGGIRRQTSGMPRAVKRTGAPPENVAARFLSVVHDWPTGVARDGVLVGRSGVEPLTSCLSSRRTRTLCSPAKWQETRERTTLSYAVSFPELQSGGSPGDNLLPGATRPVRWAPRGRSEVAPRLLRTACPVPLRSQSRCPANLSAWADR